MVTSMGHTCFNSNIKTFNYITMLPRIVSITVPQISNALDQLIDQDLSLSHTGR